MKPTHLLEIYVYTADGDCHSFYVDDQQDFAVMQRTVNPQKLFMQKQFVIAGSYFMAGFMTSEIVRVDFASAEWEAQLGGPEGRVINEVSEKEMARRCLPKLTDPRRSEIQPNAQSTIETYAEFGLVDGQKVCCRIEAKAGGRLDQRQFIQNITAGQGFVIDRRGGGFIVLNPSLISRWALYPGLAELPLNTWKAHRLDLKDEGTPSLIFKKISNDELFDDSE
ncbi:hypothetical protein GC173_17630 [bacterium]|nr:hypothetical protein [bacterium]